MWELLESIENSGWAVAIRESPSGMGYVTVLALHTFGMAFLVGLSAAFAARVLGVFPELPLGPFKKFSPLIYLGFWLNAATGVILTALSARSFFTNVDYYIKMAAIACALVTLWALRKEAFGDPALAGTKPAPVKAKVLAGAMILFWGIAVTAGRLTAYSGFVRRETSIAVFIVTVLLLVGYFIVRAASPTKAAHQAEVRTSANY